MAHSTIASLPSPNFPQGSPADTLADTIAELQRLGHERDMAAYYVVGAVQAALIYHEVADYREARSILRNSLARYEAAQANLQTFTKEKI